MLFIWLTDKSVQVFAQIEQEMVSLTSGPKLNPRLIVQNNEECIQHYNELEFEAPLDMATDPEGYCTLSRAIDFNNVQLQYRPDLPLISRCIILQVRGSKDFVVSDFHVFLIGRFRGLGMPQSTLTDRHVLQICQS